MNTKKELIMEKVLCIKRQDFPAKWVEKKSVIKIKEASFFKICSDLNFEFKGRKIVEKNPDFKQIIPYIIILTNDLKYIAAYKRKGSEERLHDLWSIGIGGHINPVDAKKNPTKIKEIILTGMQRELEEELNSIGPNDKPVFSGIINEEMTDVGSVHIGAVFTITTNHKEAYLGGDELVDFQWIETKQVSTLNLELWSKLTLELIE
ncbi:MAG: NUDIX domain-containing protein, partial [Desulfobacterales bacterium]|nr:NUDIX domain-containing protein [Desulfobacterales bacterium]